MLCLFAFSVFYFLAAINGFGLKFILAFESLLLGGFWAHHLIRRPELIGIFEKPLRFLIYISFLSIFIQVIIYSFFEYIDFHALVYPWSEARFQILISSAARLGGIYIEPGTLSNWMYSFLLLHILLKGFVDFRLALITAISMILSLSGWGVAIAIVIVLFLTFQNGVMSLQRNKIFINWKTIVLVFIIPIVFMTFLWFFLSDDVVLFLKNKISFQDGSGDVRISVYKEFFDAIPRLAFIGFGYESDFCKNCASAQDAGLFFGMSIVYGILFTMVFFGLILFSFFRMLGFKGVLLAFPLLTTKLFYWEFVVFLIFFTSFYRVFFNKRARFFRIDVF